MYNLFIVLISLITIYKYRIFEAWDDIQDPDDDEMKIDNNIRSNGSTIYTKYTHVYIIILKYIVNIDQLYI